MQLSKGFTLMEVMIVVAIVGLIAAMAYPSYQESVRKANRTEAKVDLADFAQRLQKCFTAYGQYNDPDETELCTAYKTLKAGAVKTNGQQFYSIKIENDTQTTYTLVATAIKSPQTLDTANNCNKLTLNQQGARLPALCW